MHVLVLSGGLSAERDVSLRSGRRVAEALRTARTDWEVQENDVDAGLLDRLRAHRPDAVADQPGTAQPIQGRADPADLG